MKSYRLSELGDADLRSLIARPRIDFSSVFSLVCFPLRPFTLSLFLTVVFSLSHFTLQVNPIIDHVRERGDAAVKE